MNNINQINSQIKSKLDELPSEAGDSAAYFELSDGKIQKHAVGFFGSIGGYVSDGGSIQVGVVAGNLQPVDMAIGGLVNELRSLIDQERSAVLEGKATPNFQKDVDDLKQHIGLKIAILKSTRDAYKTFLRNRSGDDDQSRNKLLSEELESLGSNIKCLESIQSELGGLIELKKDVENLHAIRNNFVASIFGEKNGDELTSDPQDMAQSVLVKIQERKRVLNAPMLKLRFAGDQFNRKVWLETDGKMRAGLNIVSYLAPAWTGYGSLGETGKSLIAMNKEFKAVLNRLEQLYNSATKERSEPRQIAQELATKYMVDLAAINVLYSDMLNTYLSGRDRGEDMSQLRVAVEEMKTIFSRFEKLADIKVNTEIYTDPVVEEMPVANQEENLQNIQPAAPQVASQNIQPPQAAKPSVQPSPSPAQPAQQSVGKRLWSDSRQYFDDRTGLYTFTVPGGSTYNNKVPFTGVEMDRFVRLEELNERSKRK